VKGGFSLFDIVITLLSITALGIVAIPEILTRSRVYDEVHAAEVLRLVAVAQARLKHDGARDTNGDGVGEYGFLADLGRPGPDGESYLARAFPTPPQGSVAKVDGFYVTVLLPDREGKAVSSDLPAAVDPELSARTFLAMAWPISAGRTGYRAYAVNHELMVTEHENADGEFSGPGIPDTSGLPLLVPDPRNERLMLPAGWPRRWTYLLPNHQARLIREELEPLGIPLPKAVSEFD
jgi:hypothetical protein